MQGYIDEIRITKSNWHWAERRDLLGRIMKQLNKLIKAYNQFASSRKLVKRIPIFNIWYWAKPKNRWTANFTPPTEPYDQED